MEFECNKFMEKGIQLNVAKNTSTSIDVAATVINLF